ncbi:MAG: hypothetical protein RJA61_275 [Candidatus Parcubacteria bacterium]|jgi:hypothetical protein
MRFIVFCLALFVLTTPFVFAQNFGAPVYLEITPQTPGPNQQVTATLTSYSTDLNAADISWFLNGALQKKGTGIKTFSFQTNDIGKTTTVSVNAVTIDGKLIEQSLTIQSAEIEMFFEADSYTPPFYKGKALYTHQGLARIVALPRFVNSEGVRINPKNLIYTWKKDGVVLQDSSGFGKQTLSLSGSLIVRPSNMEVEVSNLDGSIKSVSRRVLRSTEAEVLVYEESPLYGIRFSKAIENSLDLTQAETTLVAVPYFFSISKPLQASYSWLMNSQSVGGSDSVTFRNESKETGISRISVKAENLSKILQFGSKNFNVLFTAPEGDSSFFR